MERSILCVVCSESMCWALVRPACSHHRNMRRSIAFSLQSGLHQLAADASQCSTSGRGSRQSACKLLNSASSRLYESASPEVSAQYHQPCPAQHQDSRTSSSEATGNGGMSGRSNRTSFMSSSCTCTSQSVPHGSGHGMQLRGFAASAATIAITEAATPKAAGPAVVFKLPHYPNPATTHRKPEEVVGPHSKLLQHYRKGLNSQQLTHRVMLRAGTKRLLPLLKLYQTKINPIVVAAALSKVVEAQRMWPAYAKEQAKVVKWLQPYLEFQLRFSSPRSSVAILWAWSQLRGAARDALPSELALALLARAAPPHTTKPAILKDSSAAAATPEAKKEGDEGATKGDERPAKPRPHKLTNVAPRTLACLLHCAAQLLPPNVGSTDAHVRTAVASILYFSGMKFNQLSPQGLSMAAAGAALLDPNGPATVTFVTQAAESAVARMSDPLASPLAAADKGRLVQACAAAGTHHMPLFTKVVETSLGKIGRWAAGDVERLAKAFAAAKVRNQDLMVAAADAAVGWLSEVKSSAQAQAGSSQKDGEDVRVRRERHAAFVSKCAQGVHEACVQLKVPHAGLAAALGEQQ